MTTSASEILSHFQEYLNAEHDLREEIRIVVRDLEQTVREIQTSLQPIHQPAQTANYLSFCENALSMFHKIQEHYKQLSSKIPLNQYYRFNDHWRFVTQRVVYMCALIIYLKEERLVSREEVADMIGVQVNREDGFHIDLDDYLMGILNLTNELNSCGVKAIRMFFHLLLHHTLVKKQSRLAMNAVTAGDYSRPLRISQFIGELDAGFRLLNLKNDALRKKFDGLKYDVKKCEEVVYDLTIRGLVNKVVDNVNKS